MEELAVQLVLHGTSVMTISLVAGLLLHRVIQRDESAAAWHLVHAGGSARGLWLLALAPALRWIALPAWQLSVAVWLIVFFVWTSMLAMVLAAATGQRGLRWRGSPADKLVYGLYVAGAVAVFPAMFMLLAGAIRSS
jgi:hypothetical protein